MKNWLTAAFVVACATSALADIQDPPSNEQGPTRKLGRGVSNMVWGITELPVTVAKINQDEGNSAAAGYGVVRGVVRSCMRFHAGIFEILTANCEPYFPKLPNDIRYIHAGYQEFPPELGYESKYPYARHY